VAGVSAASFSAFFDNHSRALLAAARAIMRAAFFFQRRSCRQQRDKGVSRGGRLD
jgi:hypothetical protein